MERHITYSIVLLYFNRLDLLLKIVESLVCIDGLHFEIIIVDNCSDVDLSNHALLKSEKIKYIRLNQNYGAVARNYGIKVAQGDYVVCLDDDIIGIDKSNLERMNNLFVDRTIAAICFKVVAPISHSVMNWCHHYDERLYSDIQFETNEISEGAVAFRKSIFKITGMYYEKYFISHEGPDLACRIINNGYKVIYEPSIVVEHHHSAIGRKSWRRYYYDTRNAIWLNLRNYPLIFAIKRVLWSLSAMFVYSLRDGYFKFWLKGVFDALTDFSEVKKTRAPLSKSALEYIAQIESNSPSILYLLKKRLFKKKIQI